MLHYFIVKIATSACFLEVMSTFTSWSDARFKSEAGYLYRPRKFSCRKQKSSHAPANAEDSAMPDRHLLTNRLDKRWLRVRVTVRMNSQKRKEVYKHRLDKWVSIQGWPHRTRRAVYPSWSSQWKHAVTYLWWILLVDLEHAFLLRGKEIQFH